MFFCVPTRKGSIEFGVVVVMMMVYGLGGGGTDLAGLKSQD